MDEGDTSCRESEVLPQNWSWTRDSNPPPLFTRQVGWCPGGSESVQRRRFWDDPEPAESRALLPALLPAATSGGTGTKRAGGTTASSDSGVLRWVPRRNMGSHPLPFVSMHHTMPVCLRFVMEDMANACRRAGGTVCRHQHISLGPPRVTHPHPRNPAQISARVQSLLQCASNPSGTGTRLALARNVAPHDQALRHRRTWSHALTASITQVSPCWVT